MNSQHSSSRDDMSVASWGSSVMELGSSGGLDPRARSTSDLFDLPASRMRPKPYKKASSSRHVHTAPQQNNLVLIPEQQQVAPHLLNSLTPYQKQRRRMKKSFQFPNGESFTPRQKSIKSFPDQSPQLHKSVSCSEFSTGSPRGPPSDFSRRPFAELPRGSRPSTPKPASARSESLTGPARCMPPPPVHPSPTARLPRSSSLTKIPTAGPHPGSTGSNPYLRAAKSESSTSFLSISHRFTCEPNSNTSSKTQVVSSSTSITNSSSSSPSNHNTSSDTSTGASDSALEKCASAQACYQAINNSKPVAKLQQPPSFLKTQGAPQVSSTVDVKPKPQFQKVQTRQVANQDTRGVKRSTSSRLGSFFRRFFPSKKKKEAEKLSTSSLPTSSATAVPNSVSQQKSTPSVVVSQPRSAPPDDHEKPLLTEGTTKDHDFDCDIEDDENVDDDDDDDDQLLDIDLVFDSLLLKNDHTSLKPVSLHQPKQTLPKQEPESKALENRQSTGASEEGIIDLDLINEFSRLGTFIIDGGEPKKQAQVPPPRSLKRPRLSNKESAVGFYRHHAAHSALGLDPDQRLARNLQRDWEFVHYDATVDSSSLSSEPKKLRFGHSVYVRDTYAADEYERSDKKFIRNRRKMMQTQNMAYIDAVKTQLNQFKRSEMKVHGASLHNTHFFL
ncbi:LAQU0S06e01178g1_1 [Lachancea quebecensis]|uniref:LAQU0S06e01178g1_1 n=1 Tax=Lachancea quebecensis TaxID=1654605 RepID=A0A0P1KR23_9SACH|nr:LAQU0S06e01178g1_1 [Lachancea quebecensis]